MVGPKDVRYMVLGPSGWSRGQAQSSFWLVGGRGGSSEKDVLMDVGAPSIYNVQVSSRYVDGNISALYHSIHRP